MSFIPQLKTRMTNFAARGVSYDYLIVGLGVRIIM